VSTPKRIGILLASVGWIAPLSLAFFIGHGFAWLTYKIAIGQAEPVPLHPFDLMSALFYFAMLWLAVVIGGWTLWLTKGR
jgi:hypothetical protein